MSISNKYPMGAITSKHTYSLDLIDITIGDKVWSKNIDDEELLAGMLAVSIPLLTKTNQKKERHHKYILKTSSPGISKYRLINNVDVDSIPYIGNVETVAKYHNNNNENIYGIWLSSGNIDEYHLYMFSSSKFIQGIISLCYAFNIVDFRQFIYGYPFDYNGNNYKLPGYILNPFDYQVMVPDLDDVEEEESDNEMLIPYHLEDDDEIVSPD